MIKVGDKVRTNVARTSVPAGSIGTVTECTTTRPDEVCVEFPPSITGSRYFYRPDEGQVDVVESKFVNVIPSRAIWVTLPGDNAGHKLTEDEAQTLFRQLEEIL